MARLGSGRRRGGSGGRSGWRSGGREAAAGRTGSAVTTLRATSTSAVAITVGGRAYWDPAPGTLTLVEVPSAGLFGRGR